MYTTESEPPSTRKYFRNLNVLCLQVSAAKIPFFNPPLLQILYNGTDDDFHLRKHLQKSTDPQFPRDISYKYNLLLRYSMIYQNLHRHQRSTSARHLWIEQEHAVMRRDIGRKFLIMKLWLSASKVGRPDLQSGITRLRAVSKQLPARRITTALTSPAGLRPSYVYSCGVWIVAALK